MSEQRSQPRAAVPQRMPLAVAERIARGVADWLKPVTEELLIVGSIRRRRPTVGDIDIVIRTGSAAHNIMLCQRAARLGVHLKANGDGIIDASGRPLPIASEAGLFKALGMDYVPPERREV